MALTSADVNNVSFSIDRKGYDVDEVDVFLEHVASEVDELNAQIESLQAQLSDAEKMATPATKAKGEVVTQADLEARDNRIKELEALVADHKAEDSAIAQALVIAQRSADEIIANANKAAENTKRDAEDESQRILDKANAEKQRVLDEIRKLEDDREDARGRYSDMLKDFINSSESILTQLGAGVARKRTRIADDAEFVEEEDVAASVATYTTPTVNATVAAPATPTPTKVEKDFSGFGDTDDDIDIDDID